MQEDGTMPESQVGAIRALIEEGALSKATKLLLSRGLAVYPRTHQWRGSFGPCTRQPTPIWWPEPTFPPLSKEV
jgi:hypothetical protein